MPDGVIRAMQTAWVRMAQPTLSYVPAPRSSTVTHFCIFLLCLTYLYGLLRSIRLGLHQLLSTSPTFCPVSVCRYFMSTFFLNADIWILFWWLIVMLPPVFSVLPGILQVQRFHSKTKMPFRRSNPRWWVFNVTTSLFLTGILAF